MDGEDLPNIGDLPGLPPIGPDSVEDLMEDEEEELDLEDLLEDVLETQAAEEMFAVTQTQREPAATGASTAVQISTGELLQDLPRTADGDSIDGRRLTLDQRKVYNAALMSLLTEEQMDRYESFRRTSLKEPIRRLIQVVVGGGNPPNSNKSVIALAGVAKVFVGELVEEARRVAEQAGSNGPLQPMHVHAAFQRLKERGMIEGLQPGKRKFVL